MVISIWNWRMRRFYCNVEMRMLWFSRALWDGIGIGLAVCKVLMSWTDISALRMI